MLFSWYYKGFELLWRYLIKHSSSVDFENLDLEEVDKEMAVDEASLSSTLRMTLQRMPQCLPLLVLTRLLFELALYTCCLFFFFLFLWDA